MNEPQHPGGSLLLRVARRLAEEIGEGTVFDAQPFYSQFGTSAEEAERRARELRKLGWVLDSPRTDRSLPTGKRRLTTIGRRVWEDSEPLRVQGYTTWRDVDDIDWSALSTDDLRLLHGRISQEPAASAVEAVHRLYRRSNTTKQDAIGTRLLAELGRRTLA